MPVISIPIPMNLDRRDSRERTRDGIFSHTVSGKPVNLALEMTRGWVAKKGCDLRKLCRSAHHDVTYANALNFCKRTVDDKYIRFRSSTRPKRINRNARAFTCYSLSRNYCSFAGRLLPACA